MLAPRRPRPMMAYMDKANEPTGSALVNQLVDVIWGATEIVEPLIESVDRLAPEKLSRLSESVRTLQRLKRRVAPLMPSSTTTVTGIRTGRF